MNAKTYADQLTSILLPSDPWLIVVSDAVARQMSFFEAAEGDSWRQETDARQACRDSWKRCREALVEAGLLDEFKRTGGYLVS